MKILNSLALLLIIAAAACGASVDQGPDGSGNPPGPDGSTPTADAAPPRPDGAPVFNGVIYAHSDQQLYSVNPDTLAVTLVGPFGWPAGTTFEQMTDIAVDKDGGIIGVSFGSVYRVDPITVECTFLSFLATSFNGLSFVPASEIDPTGAEILVGTTLDGSVWQLDPMTGMSTQIGAYGGNYISSGDIVSVDGFGTIATVKEGTSDAIDILARIDFAAGATATPIGTNTGIYDIWGVGFWKGKVYGFTATNEFVQIDVTTGVATLIEDGPVNWWGAGVTTMAPIIP